MNFGDRMKQLREELNLSREQLANKFEISYSTLSKYETNARFPDRDTLMSFADFFDVSVDYLLGRVSERNFGNEISINLADFAFDSTERLKKNKNIMFNGDPACDEDINCILEAIEMGVALAKQRKEARDKNK